MSHNRDNAGNRSSTSRLVDSVDQLVRLPLEVTGATWDLMMQGVQSVTGGAQRGMQTGQRSSDTSSRAMNGASTDDRSGSSWTSTMTGQSDQDLSGDDLKYVIWSIAFTKPGFECMLEPQHDEIVNYNADGASFAALKIAKFLERARHGHTAKPEPWGDTYPPRVAKAGGRRPETLGSPGQSTMVEADTGASAASGERGWRIPAEDHKYITFLYRVDRRLPKQEIEVTRVERVTVERGGTTKII